MYGTAVAGMALWTVSAVPGVHFGLDRVLLAGRGWRLGFRYVVQSAMFEEFEAIVTAGTMGFTRRAGIGHAHHDCRATAWSLIACSKRTRPPSTFVHAPPPCQAADKAACCAPSQWLIF